MEMNRITGIILWIYSQGLKLYPKKFHASYGVEMKNVFSLAVADAARCGFIPAARTVIRELVELPENAILEHAYERRKRLNQSPYSPRQLLSGGVEIMEKSLVIMGYLLLAAAFIGYLIVTIVGLVDILPEGIVGLLLIAGLGLLLIKVIKDRLTNKEDDYYSKNVKL